MRDNPNPWTAYEPTPADPWALRKVAHLHRRAGFGATWAELQRDLKDGPAGSVDRLLKSRPVTAEETQILDSLRQGVLDSRDSERLKAWWLYRVLYDPDPLREKVTVHPKSGKLAQLRGQRVGSLRSWKSPHVLAVASWKLAMPRWNGWLPSCEGRSAT